MALRKLHSSRNRKGEKKTTWRRAFWVEGPIGLREESSRLVLGMERGRLYLSEVAKENVVRDEVGEEGRADLQCFWAE